MKKNNFSPVKEEDKKVIIDNIIYFFKTERDEEIGIISAEVIYDFILENIGNKIYNKALDDAFKYYKNYQDNMESDFYSLYRQE